MEVVLDASVILKWFLEEQLAKKSLEFRHRHLKGEIDICVPSLLVFEIVNALSTKSELSLITVTSAIEAFYFAKLNIISFSQDLSEETAKISRKYDISAYDAAYLALAKSLKCSFITADEKLYQKAKSLKFVKLLDNL